MGFPHKNELDTFREDTLPDLSTTVLGALELFVMEPLEPFTPPACSRPLVVGSANAAQTGKLLFADVHGALFADESSISNHIDNPEIDLVVLVSASGGKHAVGIAKLCKEYNKKMLLLTNNPNPLAREHNGDMDIRVFPKNREPYTYNTSTYLAMLLARTGESPKQILQYIEEEISERMPGNLKTYSAFCCMVPPAFADVRSMLRTKFDELFGPKVAGRVFTFEEIKHAKTVIEDEHELFISFGAVNDVFGAPEHRLDIPLPETAEFATMLAVGYYVIGRIQEALPPYFIESIDRYTKEATQLFGQEIKTIVE